MKKSPIPVFMYHSVGIPNKKWKWNNLTIPYQNFEAQLLFLKKNNYNTINLSDLYEHIFHDKAIPKKPIILTFDDGYADNYIFAYPLLKKFGFIGTIFVNPEFVDPRNIVRQRIDETSDINKLETFGFLSWDEMKIMEKDNTIDIQSHAMTHTWYPISDQVIDFRHPNDEYCWMTWNSHPKQKPFLQIENYDLVGYGSPVYKNEKSLMAKTFIPDNNLTQHLVDFVRKLGDFSFFSVPNWKEILTKEYNKYREQFDVATYFETEKEYLDRIRYELRESKRIIEEKLNKKIEFLCWPGGSGTTAGVNISKEVGYKMTTAARDINSSIRKKIKNDGTIFADRIRRTSPTLITINKMDNKEIIYADGIGIYLRIISFHKSAIVQKVINGFIIIYGNLYKLIYR